jgi:N-terminal domain of anti-restriction factor ArdC
MTSPGHLRQQVNDTIIQALGQGKVPWRSDHGFPKNVLSRRRYGGIEAICLMLAGCPSPYWGTRSSGGRTSFARSLTCVSVVAMVTDPACFTAAAGRLWPICPSRAEAVEAVRGTLPE